MRNIANNFIAWCNGGVNFLTRTTNQRILQDGIGYGFHSGIKKTHRSSRLRGGQNVLLFHASKLEIDPSDWDATRQEIKAKVLYDAEKWAAFNETVADHKSMMLEIYNAAIVKKEFIE